MQTLPLPESRADCGGVCAPGSSSPLVLSSVARLREGPARPSPARAVNSEALSPILVADDDPDDTFFIERLIKRTGISNPVRTFSDGSEVVDFLGGAWIDGRFPRLLFLDLKMRGLGGFGFLAWARRQKGHIPLTIVVLSSVSDPPAVARALSLGAHRYLTKYPCARTMETIVRSVYPQTAF